MAQIAVGLVQQNPLAVPSLVRLLRRNKMTVYTNEDLLLRRPPGRGPLSVFVLDIGALSMPLVAYLQQLRHQHPNAKILLLGNKSIDSPLLLMLELGAHGFVRYKDATRSLPTAINAIVANQFWFPPRLVVQFTKGMKQPEERWQSLTRRERLIVRLLERRLSNKEIATLLRISGNTIKFHMSNLFRKLAVHSRQAIIAAAALQKLRGELNNNVSATHPLDLPPHSYGRGFTNSHVRKADPRPMWRNPSDRDASANIPPSPRPPKFSEK